jgi:orotate phosphoribosyltransferase
VKACGGQVVGIAILVDRSNHSVIFDSPLVSLISLHVETFDPAQLPPDLALLPATKPGSK